MTFCIEICVSPWIEKFIWIYILSWNHLAVASEMFVVFLWQLYEMNQRNCHKIKLRDENIRIENLQDMENEVDYDGSN